MAGIPRKYGKAGVNLILDLLIVLGGIYFVPKILFLCMPFVIGGLLAWIVAPIVRFLEEKLRIRRKPGSALVIVTLIAGNGFLIYYIVKRLLLEMSDLLRLLPDMLADMKVKYGWVLGELGVPSADAVGNFAVSIPDVIIGIVMSLLSAYFFVAEKEGISIWLKKIIPWDWRKKCFLLKQLTVDVITGYIKAQMKIEVWVYLVIAVGLLLIKVPYGCLVAIPIAFLDLLPVFGTGTVLIPWAVVKALWGEYMYAVGFMGIWGISQLVRQIIQPKVIGDSMGMAPFPSLILLFAGYKAAGGGCRRRAGAGQTD